MPPALFTRAVYNADVPDDPSDAFDKFADAIRSQKDELDAVDALRSAKEADKRKREPNAAEDATPDPTRPPQDD